MDRPPSLLRVDASIRREGSVTRSVADSFEQSWLATHPGSQVVRRDVGVTPPAYLNEVEHTAMFVPPEARSPEMVVAQAGAAVLADELFAADAILIAAPLYNLGIPAGLKSWLDHVYTDLRLFPGFGLTQPLAGRRCVVVTARGGAYGPGSPMHGWDYENPFLRRQLVDILGLELTEVVVDLTLAHMDPRKSHLVPVAEQSHREGHEQAERLGRELLVEQAAESAPRAL